MTLPAPEVMDAAAVGTALPMLAAITALRSALLAGLDPEADPPRSVVPVRQGQLLLMPAAWGGYAGVKLATVTLVNPGLGRPRIQGIYLLMDAETLTPLAVLDGGALTAIRTAAGSAVAVQRLAEPDAAWSAWPSWCATRLRSRRAGPGCSRAWEWHGKIWWSPPAATVPTGRGHSDGG